MGYKAPGSYTINLMHGVSSPVDATTYFCGSSNSAISATAAVRRVYIQKAGRITRLTFQRYAVTAGTAEDWTLLIRLNNTTDYAFAMVASATNQRLWENYALNIPVVAGDYIELKETTPTWATNPDNMVGSGTAYIETE